MRCLFIILFTLFALPLFSQNQWKKEEIAVLNAYGLDTLDHRGVILHVDVQSDLMINEALLSFFKADVKKDMSEFWVSFDDRSKPYLEKPLDIHNIVQLYLNISK